MTGDMVPGVPSAGHVTGRGFWHPGRAEGCVKCAPPVRVRWCQLCELQGIQTKAAWDAKTIHGPWADLCGHHLLTDGVSTPSLWNRLDGEDQ